MMERRRYNAIEYWFTDDVDDQYEALRELEDHLQMNGYDYYLSAEPQFEQITVLLINEDQAGWIDEVLEDRGIKFRYVE